MFCVLYIIVNLIIFFPWKIEYAKYKNITNYNNRSRQPVSNSINSTKNSSKLQNDNVNEKVFERSPTETIIACSGRNNNLNLNNLNIGIEIYERNNNINNNKNNKNSINNNNIEIKKFKLMK